MGKTGMAPGGIVYDPKTVIFSGDPPERIIPFIKPNPLEIIVNHDGEVKVFKDGKEITKISKVSFECEAQSIPILKIEQFIIAAD